MPKTVSWNDKENIVFINCVGKQKKLRRKTMSSKKSEADVYKDYIAKLEAQIVQKDEEIVQKDMKIRKLNEQVTLLNQQVLHLGLEAAAPSRKISTGSDSSSGVNMSVGSDASNMSVVSTKSK